MIGLDAVTWIDLDSAHRGVRVRGGELAALAPTFLIAGAIPSTAS